MKRLAHILASLSLGLSGLQLIHLRQWLGLPLMYLLRPWKLLAGALAPFLALLGAAGAVLGILGRDCWAVAAGGLGALLHRRFVKRVTAPHGAFDHAFGSDWQSGIPPELVGRLNQRRWTWRMTPAPCPRWQRDLVFWTLPGQLSGELTCDLWQPPDWVQPSGLGVIFLHGGGWVSFDKDSYTRPLFQHLAAQGHAIMDVAYRLYPETDMRGMVADVKRAVNWLKLKAERYGVNPASVVLGGGSAGGHLALMAAFSHGHPDLTPTELVGVDTSVSGVFAFYPAVDPWAYAEYGVGRSRVVAHLLGGYPSQCPEQHQLMKPITHVRPGCPATLLLQAGHDDVVPIVPVRALYQELVANKVPAVYLEYPQTEHAFDLFLPQYSPAAQAAWYDLERFLALLVCEPEPHNFSRSP